MSKITVDVSRLASLSGFIHDEMQRKLHAAVEQSLREYGITGTGLAKTKRPDLRLVLVNPDAKLTNACQDEKTVV